MPNIVKLAAVMKLGAMMVQHILWMVRLGLKFSETESILHEIRVQLTRFK